MPRYRRSQDTKPAPQADMLMMLEEGFEEAKWAFLKTQDGKRDWWNAAFRTVRSTLSFGRSRGMKPSLRQRGKWWN